MHGSPSASRLRVRGKFFRADADGCACGAGTHTGRAAVDALAHIAFDRFLELADMLVMWIVRHLARAVAAAEHQPLHQAWLLRRLGRHVDHAVRTVALTVAATDAVVGDENLAVGRAMDRIGRAILHAMRVFAMTTRGRHVHIGEGGSGLTIQPRVAVVGFGAGFFAIVAAHAQRFVDQQNIGRFAGTLGKQERNDVAAAGHCLHRQICSSALAVF